MFLNWQGSTKSVLVALMFRASRRVVRVSQAALARLPLVQRRKVVRLVTPADIESEG